MTDLCLCEYTSHGHCGLVRGEKVHNDETLPLLGETAASHAAAGSDIIAPSGMMDHMVRALRRARADRGISEAIFSRRSFIAAMNKLILMSGCIQTRSNIYCSPD